MKRLISSACFLFLFFCHGQAQSKTINGKVLDGEGNPVPFARVLVIYADGRLSETRTSDDGSFSFHPEGALPARLQALAPGYSIAQRDLSDSNEADVSITLHPARVADSVTVTAARTQIPMSRSTQSVLVLPREEREMSAAQTIDDYLRKVPGFTLFRRTSSMVAHPTSQGVSLRGVGPSGASRSLVMADGIPLNDPFGGWVYWSRVPRIALDRIEILRGGASELYGADALGGVIQLFRRPPSSRTLNLEGYLGNFDTSDYAFFASDRVGRHGMALSGEFFRTEGYVQVSPAERGRVDIAARSKHHAVEALWEYRLNPDSKFYALASLFSEQRGNGTPLQSNDTQIRSLAGGASFVTGGKNQWTIQTFALAESFDAYFSAVASNRGSESLTRSQRVPAQGAGVLGLWRRLLGQKHLLLAGTDYTHVKGASDELIFTGGVATGASRSDGRQDRGGFYFQDLFQATARLQLVFGTRWDAWSNHEAFSFNRTFSAGSGRQTLFPSRDHVAWSPKFGARVDLSENLSLRGSVSRSFRAPTLNELYRSFRVGNAVTNANPDLDPERAISGEFGLDWGLQSPLAFRGTFFWYETSGNIANVTLSSTPTLITRERQNLGTTRSRGLELDTVYHPDPRWTISAGYFLADATVTDAPKAPDLIGLRLPQVPRHQGVLQLQYNHPRQFFANVLLRLSGKQFDDDQNQFPLGSYRIVDVSLGKPVARFAELFIACENLFDQLYAVGRTPVMTVGMPRRVHGGLRIRLE